MNALSTKEKLEELSLLTVYHQYSDGAIRAQVSFCRQILQVVPSLHALQSLSLSVEDPPEHSLLISALSLPSITNRTLYDYKLRESHVESLEAAVRNNTTVTTLVLGCMDDSSLIPFLTGLKSNSNVQDLSLSMEYCSEDRTYKEATDLLAGSTLKNLPVKTSLTRTMKARSFKVSSTVD